jgi:hypothetical protein
MQMSHDRMLLRSQELLLLGLFLSLRHLIVHLSNFGMLLHLITLPAIVTKFNSLVKQDSLV